MQSFLLMIKNHSKCCTYRVGYWCDGYGTQFPAILHTTWFRYDGITCFFQWCSVLRHLLIHQTDTLEYLQITCNHCPCMSMDNTLHFKRTIWILGFRTQFNFRPRSDDCFGWLNFEHWIFHCFEGAPDTAIHINQKNLDYHGITQSYPFPHQISCRLL